MELNPSARADELESAKIQTPPDEVAEKPRRAASPDSNQAKWPHKPADETGHLSASAIWASEPSRPTRLAAAVAALKYVPRVRNLAPLFAALFSATIAGCSGGGDGASAHGGSFTIVTDIDFTTQDGTFKVAQGSEALGCSSGTFVDHFLGAGEYGTGESSGTILKVLTCADGERSGSFLIRFIGIDSSRWNFRRGTGDFVGVKGNGKFHLRFSRGPEISGVETITGTARFP